VYDACFVRGDMAMAELVLVAAVGKRDVQVAGEREGRRYTAPAGWAARRDPNTLEFAPRQELPAEDEDAWAPEEGAVFAPILVRAVNTLFAQHPRANAARIVLVGTDRGQALKAARGRPGLGRRLVKALEDEPAQASAVVARALEEWFGGSLSIERRDFGASQAFVEAVTQDPTLLDIVESDEHLYEFTDELARDLRRGGVTSVHLTLAGGMPSVQRALLLSLQGSFGQNLRLLPRSEMNPDIELRRASRHGDWQRWYEVRQDISMLLDAKRLEFRAAAELARAAATRLRNLPRHAEALTVADQVCTAWDALLRGASFEPGSLETPGVQAVHKHACVDADLIRRSGTARHINTLWKVPFGVPGVPLVGAVVRAVYWDRLRRGELAVHLATVVDLARTALLTRCPGYMRALTWDLRAREVVVHGEQDRMTAVARDHASSCTSCSAEPRRAVVRLGEDCDEVIRQRHRAVHGGFLLQYDELIGLLGGQAAEQRLKSFLRDFVDQVGEDDDADAEWRSFEALVDAPPRVAAALLDHLRDC
jgi:hypothetical protein